MRIALLSQNFSISGKILKQDAVPPKFGEAFAAPDPIHLYGYFIQHEEESLECNNPLTKKIHRGQGNFRKRDIYMTEGMHILSKLQC